MELKQDICPHCGGTETVIGKQFDRASVYRENAFMILGGSPLFHVVCLDCGTVIRSYVKNPKTLAF